MKNNIGDLSDMLFDQLDRLDDETVCKTDEDLKNEIEKTKLKVELAKNIISIADIQLRAVQMAGEYGLKSKEMPALISNHCGEGNVLSK